jgi:hypothetical protein
MFVYVLKMTIMVTVFRDISKRKGI